MMSMMEQFLPIILQNDSRRRAHRRVVRLPRRRGLQLHRVALRDGSRAASAPRDRRQREPPSVDRRELATGARAPARDRRLHLDRLGLPRRGRHRTSAVRLRQEIGGFMGEYPWLTANCGDFDITGHRRPVSYWREIVWGLRDTPYVAVRPPAHHGEATSAGTGWSFTDAIASWSWPGFEGQADHGRGVRRRRRGRAPRERHAGRSRSRR